jgi:hypothetical protein
MIYTVISQLMRIPGFARLWRSFPVGGPALRTEWDVWSRPHYAYGLYWAAYQAQMIGIHKITAIEFGVAGGNGLIALESCSIPIGEHFGVAIDVVGFDSGVGMPEPVDYKDLPHCWQSGFYKIDRQKLEGRLKRAHLAIGPVSETVAPFLREKSLAPIGFIAFDLDYYSSTKAAFTIFSGPDSTRLPRIYCYFDDIIVSDKACLNDRVGELRAIAELNTEATNRYLAPINGLSWMRLRPAMWNDMMYVYHDFGHPAYAARMTPHGEKYEQLPLVD